MTNGEIRMANGQCCGLRLVGLVAVLFGVTASCLGASPASQRMIDTIPPVPRVSAESAAALLADLEKEVTELLDRWPWAPFYISIGIGSRDFMFAHPSFAVETLAWAYPHLPAPLAQRARARAAEELANCLNLAPLSTTEGRRRELFDVPPNDMFWPQKPDWPAISHVYAIWLYGHRTGDWDSVSALWPRIRNTFAAYAARPLNVAQPAGRVHMNRTAAGLAAYVRLARRFDPQGGTDEAIAQLDRLLAAIIAYWQDRGATCGKALAAVEAGQSTSGQGELLYLNLRNHFLKLAIFLDMTPDLAAAIAEAQPAAAASIQRYVDLYMPCYYLAFEERQVHYGENFVDLPDSIHGIYRCKAFLWKAPADVLARHSDLPWVKADLFHIQKLVFAAEATAR